MSKSHLIQSNHGNNAKIETCQGKHKPPESKSLKKAIAKSSESECPMTALLLLVLSKGAKLLLLLLLLFLRLTLHRFVEIIDIPGLSPEISVEQLNSVANLLVHVVQFNVMLLEPVNELGSNS